MAVESEKRAYTFIGQPIPVCKDRVAPGLTTETGRDSLGAMQDLERRLSAWVERGLITPEQAAAIGAMEAEASGRGATSGSGPSEGRGPSLAATALGYLGASVALVGGIVAVSREWSELETAARLAISGGATLVVLAGGFLARRSGHPALRPLDGFLWFLSAAGAAFTAGLLGHDVLGLEARSFFFLAGMAAAAWALPLWRIRPGTLLEMAVVAGLATALESALEHLPGPPDEFHGLPAWGLGAVLALLGWGRLLFGRRGTFAVAGVLLLLGAQVLSFGWRPAGLGLGIGTAVALLAASVPLRSMVHLGFGAAGVLLFLPQIVFEYLGDTLGAPLALLVSGIALLAGAFPAARLSGKVRAEGGRPGEPRRDSLEKRAGVAAVGVALLVAAAIWAFGIAPLPDYPSLAQHPDPSIPGRIAFVRFGERPCLHVVDAGGGAARRLLCSDEESWGRGEVAWFGGPIRWTRDGRIVVQAFGPAGPEAIVVDPETGRVRERVSVDEPLAERPLPDTEDARVDGATLIVRRSGRDAAVGIVPVDASPREVARVSGPPTYAFWEGRWSPDGEWILVRDSNQDLLVVRAAEGAPLRLLADRVSGPFAWHIPGRDEQAIDLDSLRAAR